jgi:predicted DNA-binding WGR domain protein
MHHTKIDPDIIFKSFDIRELLCVVPERNRRRFYRIEISQGLWCPLVIRAWGRIGSTVKVKLDFHNSLEEALAGANKLLGKRLRRGYSVKSESLVENALPVHPVEIKNVRIRRNNADDNLSFPFFQ